MPRYFIEVAYVGTNYAGFQKQNNANTIQAEIEKALLIFYKQNFELTGSSRTDAGVHAKQNFFHVDSNIDLTTKIYNLNAILPQDIVLKKIFLVEDNKHARFDAISREYHYHIHYKKNPFLNGQSYYFPYTLDVELLEHMALLVLHNKNFTAFSKKHTQVLNFNCEVYSSSWIHTNNQIIYQITANRFLRGMVKALVATMLQVATKKVPIEHFLDLLNINEISIANFSSPSTGLFLNKVQYNFF